MITNLSSVEVSHGSNFHLDNIKYFLVKKCQSDTGQNVEKHNCSGHDRGGVGVRQPQTVKM